MEELGRPGYPLRIDSRTTEDDDRVRTGHIGGDNQQLSGGPREERPSQCSQKDRTRELLEHPNRTPGQRRAGWATRTAKASERGGVNSVTDMVPSADDKPAHYNYLILEESREDVKPKAKTICQA